MPVRVDSREDGVTRVTTSAVIRGVQYVIDQKNAGVNVRVISMSLGIAGTSKEDLPCYSSWTTAIDMATEADILCVVAVGNESSPSSLSPVSVPACYDKCLAVGSINSSHTRSYYSNGDDTLDVVAPGESILSTTPAIASTEYNQYYEMSGTSMAAPYVAAIASLCFKYNPSATYEQVMEAIEYSALDLGETGRDDEYGYGQVRPARAVSLLSAYDDGLTFVSDEAFSLRVSDGTGGWDGTLSWFDGNTNSWITWTGEELTASCSQEGEAYTLRIKGDASNTTITAGDINNRWIIETQEGNTVSCLGSVEILRGATDGDAATTPMASQCYAYLFSGCTALAIAPSLPATQLAQGCYQGMFCGCTALMAVTNLPATQLEQGCYESMFEGCTTLKTASDLPATQLAQDCCKSMFQDCTALSKTPNLPAAELAQGCYQSMFCGCTALVTASKLPAEELAQSCYQSMFCGCTSLARAPALPAEELAQSCYQSMFCGCTALVTAPKLPAEELAPACYKSMFCGCTALPNCPKLPAATLVDQCYANMFTGATTLSAPAQMEQVTQIDMTQSSDVGCCQEMYKDCTGMYLFASASDCRYTSASWKATSVSSIPPSTWAKDMFTNTSGTFTGTPKCGGEYFLDTIPYREYDADTGQYVDAVATSFIEIDASMDTWGSLDAETWYVLSKGSAENPYSINHSVSCLGTVHLVLMDGCALTISTTEEKAGLCVLGKNNALRIHGQTQGTGMLTASGGDNGAGIGSYGDSVSRFTLSIVIDGGIITATGGVNAAGIGSSCTGVTTDITINGGTVSAAGSFNGAGIGGGDCCDGSNITINGGTVTATGGWCAAGIGGGQNGDGTNITINGGMVAATSPVFGAGIGGGLCGRGADITINGGAVSATAGENNDEMIETDERATSIGGGIFADSERIFIASDRVVKAGDDTPPATVIAHTDTTDLSLDSNFERKHYVTVKGTQTLMFSQATVDKTYGDGTFTNTLSGATTPVVFESSAENVAMVDSNGQVTIVGPGTATITATALEDDAFESVAASYVLNVAEAKGFQPQTGDFANVLTGDSTDFGFLCLVGVVAAAAVIALLAFGFVARRSKE